MRVAVHTALFIAGALVVAATLLSAVRSMILPRGVPSRIGRAVFLVVRVAFTVRAGRSASYQRRDRIMAMYAPIALLSLLTTWIALTIAGCTAMYLGLGVHNLRTAFLLSGSSVFTLGTTSTSHTPAAVLTFIEAGLGFLLVALLITYLPSIYTAFSRRELAVAMLEVRAGRPPSAAELLLRHYRIEKLNRLGELWAQWEGWFVDIQETHTSLPSLVFFRSPEPDHSWVTAAGTILDAASLRASTLDIGRDPDSELCIRAGYLALRRIANFFRLPYDPSPRPDDPITIRREEFDQVYDQLKAEGVPVVKNRDQAWKGFAGWRVNYDTVLLNLARFTEAPLAPWTSDRSPLPGHLTWTFRDMLRGRYSGGMRRRGGVGGGGSGGSGGRASRRRRAGRG